MFALNHNISQHAREEYLGRVCCAGKIADIFSNGGFGGLKLVKCSSHGRGGGPCMVE